MYRQHDNNIGYFVEKEFKNEFTYRETKDEWALKHGFKYECDVGFHFNHFFCNVKKTRVNICTDEDCEGNPIVETWVITKNIVFVK